MIAQELKSKWVSALRSGEYKQGVGQLRNGDSFCCLGVLCQIAGIPISPNGKSATSEDASNGSMDYRALSEIGVNSVLRERLWQMNDFERRAFDEIADRIEKETCAA